MQSGPASMGGGALFPPPPSKSSWAALRRFLRGCHQALLYPPEHTEFASALQLARDACRELVTAQAPCVLHLGPQGLSLSGTPCPPETSPERFATRLRERGIPALTLRPEVTEAELEALLELLRADPELVVQQGGPQAWLIRAGVRGITLDPLRTAPVYRPRWEAFLAAQPPAEGEAFARLLALCAEEGRQALSAGAPEEAVLSWLAEALAAAAAIGGEAWLATAAAAMRTARPAALARLFRAPARPESDALTQVALRLTPAEAVEVLVAYPGAVTGEPSAQLEVELARLLPTAARAAEVEPVAKARLLARGLTEESYRSIVALTLARQLPEATGGAPEPASGAAGKLSFLAELLASTSPRALLGGRLEMWLELVLLPGDWEGKGQVVGSLAESLPTLAKERREDRIVELLRRVQAAIAQAELAPDDRRRLRAHLAAACTGEVCDELARFVLRGACPECRDVLLLLSGAEGGLEALLRVAREAAAPWLCGAAGVALLRMGDRSLEACHSRLAAGPPQEAIALARALVLSGVPEGLARALWAQEHPEARVEAAVMELLAESRDPRAERVLLNALRSDSAEVQSAAAWALGGHPSERSVAALGALLSGMLGSRRIEVMESALDALGRMGRKEAIPALRTVLRRRYLLFRNHARRLQALACQALARIPDPAAEQVLRDEARDDPEGLAAFCAEALEARPTLLREARRELA